jgi:tetratricopeptide (TPR) repeat protein
MTLTRRAVMTAGAVALLTLAALAAYGAREAQNVGSEIGESDAAFRLDPAREGLWAADTNAPGVERLLAVRDDVLFRRASRLFELVRRRGRNPFDSTSRALRADIQLGLARAEQAKMSNEAHSKAVNLEALLVLEDALGDFANGAALAERSLDDFRRAIRIDPENEEAMFNLELVLRLLQPEQARLQVRYGIDPRGRRVPGASSVRRGSGY